ncbi:helix-turn-helix domain-containing protein [Myxococcota bacterium]|nr:helix-turn-helix domain-containing protein [Myxococcota bacterium]
MTTNKSFTHYTADAAGFRSHLALDCMDQVQRVMAESGITQRALAAHLKISEGRVSQLLNSPGNLTLDKLVQLAFAVDRKLGILLYDDDDRKHAKGPVFGEVFRRTWELAGKPRTGWDLEELEQEHTMNKRHQLSRRLFESQDLSFTQAPVTRVGWNECASKGDSERKIA